LSLVSVFYFTFSVSSKQSPTITDGLTNGTKILERPRRGNDFQSKYISKELVQQFLAILSSKNDESFCSTIFGYFATSLEGHWTRTRQLFSMSLNRPFLRILRCSGSFASTDVVYSYSIAITGLTIEQKRLVANSGVLPVLIALVSHKIDRVVNYLLRIMTGLGAGRDGEDYALFVETALFDRIMQNLPSSTPDLPSAVVAVAGGFPLPACCAELLTFLNDWTRSGSWNQSAQSLEWLTSLVFCRGLISYALASIVGNPILPS
jgi:hypothetical protein